MSKKVFLFPGQGGQFIGQGRAWTERSPSIKEIFQMADDVSGRPISKLCFEGPMEDLSKTVNLQPAVLAVSLAALRLMKEEAEPDYAAGHSLGEFGALCAAGVLDEETALRLVTKRAALMNENAEKHPGAMMAVIGLSVEALEGICELARNEGLVVTANFNTPEQTVISGDSRAVSAAGKFIKMKSGRAIALPVSGAFHSALMADAAACFAEELGKIDFREPICPVVPNSLGTPVQSAAEIKENLLKQIISPVLWTKTVASLIAAGATEFIEAWPKAYLGALTKKCLPAASEAVVSFCSK
ncbi:MAG: ACP S-malonyltransferase [Candidatus Adiutrix sp.]|jgi:[acyl-carrier-protein] S-malonyltransferase|nr:ACP S-malonyltransferase [Candidatus Adiutrix sp.]